MSISQKDREILRGMAAHQQELANAPEMQARIKDWQALNNFRMRRPMVYLEMGTFAHEVIPKRMRCEGEEARGIEWSIYENTLQSELFNDDFVVPDYFPMSWRADMNLFGMASKREHAHNADGAQTLGHQFVHSINDLEEDWDKLGHSTWSVDRAGTLQWMETVDSVIGDILPVKLTGRGLYSVPTQKVVHIMGMEAMFMNMMDYPELFGKMMQRAADETIAYFRFLEEEKLLLPTTYREHIGQGSYCFTEELPSEAPAEGLRTKDIWGFMDSQETVGLNPELYGELVWPYYKQIASEYGLFSYGCCEPVDTIWKYLSEMDNLRKVSISPWCDQAFMGEALRGRKTIFHRKPSPNYLGVDVSLDEDAFRKHIMETVNAAKGCTLEITQRDVYTIHSNEAKARRYVDIIRECTV